MGIWLALPTCIKVITGSSNDISNLHLCIWHAPLPKATYIAFKGDIFISSLGIKPMTLGLLLPYFVWKLIELHFEPLLKSKSSSIHRCSFKLEWFVNEFWGRNSDIVTLESCVASVPLLMRKKLCLICDFQLFVWITRRCFLACWMERAVHLIKVLMSVC